MKITGIDRHVLLAPDIKLDELPIVDGRIPRSTHAGIGVEIDRRAIRRYAVG